MDARSIVASTLALQRSHPAAMPLEILDLVLQGTAGQTIDFSDLASPGGSLAWPSTAFGQVIAAAFDPVMPAQDWLVIDLAVDAAAQAPLHAIWREDVIQRLANRYRIVVVGA